MNLRRIAKAKSAACNGARIFSNKTNVSPQPDIGLRYSTFWKVAVAKLWRAAS